MLIVLKNKKFKQVYEYWLLIVHWTYCTLYLFFFSSFLFGSSQCFVMRALFVRLICHWRHPAPPNGARQKLASSFDKIRTPHVRTFKLQHQLMIAYQYTCTTSLNLLFQLNQFQFEQHRKVFLSKAVLLNHRLRPLNILIRRHWLFERRRREACSTHLTYLISAPFSIFKSFSRESTSFCSIKFNSQDKTRSHRISKRILLYSYYYYFTVSTHSWANPGKKILSKFKSRKIYKQTGIISIQSHLIHREGVFHNVLESNRFEIDQVPHRSIHDTLLS